MFVIGMPHKFSCKEGEGKLVWEWVVAKVVQVEYAAREWVKPVLPTKG